MIVTWSFLAISLFIGFIFLGIKMSETIKHGDIKMFFFGLYFITLVTVINIVLSFYFYHKTIKKKGPIGLRGIQGKPGERGDNGVCEPKSCKMESIKLAILKHLKSEITKVDGVKSTIYDSIDIVTDKGKIEELEEVICGFFKSADLTEFQNLTQAQFEYFYNELSTQFSTSNNTDLLKSKDVLDDLTTSNTITLNFDSKTEIPLEYSKC